MEERRSIVSIVRPLLIAIAAVIGLGALGAEAAEIRVVTSVALTSALDALAPKFEQATGNKLAITYGLNAELRKRMLEGEAADVIILSHAVMEELTKAARLSGGITDMAGTSVSVAVRAGAPKPDIGTVEAFKAALLAAKSIVYADPAKGGASGVYFAKVAERLGIAEAVKAKSVLVPGAQAADVVAKGEAELGIAQASEIVPVTGAQLVGPFPGELGNTLVFTAGVGAAAKSPEAAAALIKYLTAPDMAPFWKSKGFEAR